MFFLKYPLSQSKKGILALVTLAFCFGLIAITARYLSFQYSLFQQLYLTVFTGFIFSLFIFPRTLSLKKLSSISIKDWIVMVSRVLIGYLFAASLYREALTLTKISNVTFIQSIPFAAILGWLLFHEKPTLRKVLFLILAYIGVIIISIHDFSSLTNFGKGELFSLVSTIFFALSFVARKWQSDHLTDKEIAQILLAIGTVVLFTASIIAGEGLPVLSWELLSILSLLMTGLLNALNIYLINYGFRHVHVVLASNILTLESLFALVLAIIFYREFPNLKELVGGIIIIASVIGMNKVEK